MPLRQSASGRSEDRHLRDIGVRITRETRVPEDWDPFVRTSPGGTHCHLSGWRRIMERVLGHECLYLTARDEEGALEGILPIVAVRSQLFGRYLVSMPFLNYGGPLGSARARAALAQWARQRAINDGADLLELRWRASAIQSDLEAETAPPTGYEIHARKVTVVLPLPNDPEVMWTEGLKSKVRSQVRRPMKEGYEVRIGPDEVGPFYDVFARNMRDLGTPVLDRRLFEEIARVFHESVTYATVYDHDTPIAAGCGFHFGDEFEITWASSLREYSRTAPNMLLYWRLIGHAIERGASVFNFGRCTPGGGTHRFKLQWGGVDESLPWATWSRGEDRATPNPEQGRYRIATALWKRLPVLLTRLAGPYLARRIP